MRHSWLLACIFVLGCHDASKDIQALSDRACACKDKACADKVIDELAAIAKDKSARGDEDKIKAATTSLVTCAITAGSEASAIMSKLQAAAE